MARQSKLIFSALLIALFLDYSATAESSTPNFKFHGNLTVVDCTVNDNKSMTVDFGDAVGVHKINGKNYSQPVPFEVKCTAPDSGSIPPLKLTISGSKTDFDKTAVTTTVDGLGVQVQRNGVPQELNKPIVISYSDLPVLTVVPVLKPGTELSARSFSGGIKLILEIQ